MPEWFRGLICGKEFPEVYKLCPPPPPPFSKINIKPLIGKNADKGQNKFSRRMIFVFISEGNIIKILWRKKLEVYI